MNRQYGIKLAVLSALTLLTYIPTFVWMVGRWTATETYYSHGFLVPFISGFIVWLKRNKLSALEIKPSAIGWYFFAIGISVHLVSAFLQVYFTSGFSIILILIGLILLFLGRDFLKTLLFPVSFLIFMLPLPLVLISNLSFRLKIFAASLATVAVNLLGISASREGSVILTKHSYLVVEDPCSGIRSLIALIALCVLMVYFSTLPKFKKMILLFLAVPIAILSNVLRIIILTLITEIYGPRAATGLVHDLTGVSVFIFSFLGLFFLERILE